MTDSPATAGQVLIVGAGPTGLVLALWLTKLGVSVRIIDRTAEPGTTSRALGVHARTLELYRQLDMANAVVARGVRVGGVNLWTGGVKAARVPFGEVGEGLTPFPYFLIFPQDAHERLLIERLSACGVQVERQTELLHFDQQSETVRAVLRRPGASEETCEVAFLAGCDGGHSTVRESLSAGFPGGTYSRLFYVADVDADGPATNDELHVDLEEADLLAIFPLQGQGRVRLVGTVVEGAPGDSRALTFDDVGKRAIEHLQLAITNVNWFSTYRVHHRVAGSLRQGRVFLLGDAGHLHSPVGAQGMNTGVGDAVNLAWKLAAVLRGGAAWGLLDSYQAERIGFARRLVATTDRVFTIAVRRGALAERIRTRLVPRAVPRLFRVAPLRRFFFRTLSQLGVNYRRGPLSEGVAGGVRGGDRLPWVQTGPTEDNFIPLTSVAWCAHVYGEARPGIADACAELRLPLHTFTWKPEMKAAGFKRGALYLVRPDGYVALADPESDPRRLARYFGTRGLRP